jgi:hypothetical protein
MFLYVTVSTLKPMAKVVSTDAQANGPWRSKTPTWNSRHHFSDLERQLNALQDQASSLVICIISSSVSISTARLYQLAPQLCIGRRHT